MTNARQGSQKNKSRGQASAESHRLEHTEQISDADNPKNLWSHFTVWVNKTGICFPEQIGLWQTENEHLIPIPNACKYQMSPNSLGEKSHFSR